MGVALTMPSTDLFSNNHNLIITMFFNHQDTLNRIDYACQQMTERYFRKPISARVGFEAYASITRTLGMYCQYSPTKHLMFYNAYGPIELIPSGSLLHAVVVYDDKGEPWPVSGEDLIY